ncbi:MAG: hypothetical protein Q8P22_07980 [Chloroflexota bacterium]|nr:hypothetical protein [Chloroflexota bacterium]
MSAKGSVKQVRKRFDALVAALERVLETADADSDGRQASLRPLRAALGGVGRAVRRLEEGASHGSTGEHLLQELETDLAALWDELGEIRVRPVSEPGRRVASRSLLREVEVPADRLEEALKRLSQEERLTTSPLTGPVKLLRDALKQLDRRAAKGVSLQEMVHWCDRFPEVRWDDPRQVRRVARIALLNGIPGQMWEVRRCSSAPGRPLLPVNQSTFFPDEQTLDDCNQACGHRSNYYVAATRPRWRIVWTFRREAGYAVAGPY